MYVFTKSWFTIFFEVSSDNHKHVLGSTFESSDAPKQVFRGQERHKRTYVITSEQMESQTGETN